MAGIEARGFILGGAIAHQLKAGFVPMRKRGKLPGETYAVEYALEYGVDAMEMHLDACAAGERVMLIDDLIATGGTAIAAIDLLRRAGADVVAAAFVIDLPDLGGADRLRALGVPVTHPGRVFAVTDAALRPRFRPNRVLRRADPKRSGWRMTYTRAWRNFRRMQDSALLFAGLIYLGAVLHAWRILPGPTSARPAVHPGLSFGVPGAVACWPWPRRPARAGADVGAMFG